MKVKDVKKCIYFKTLWAEKLFSAACFPLFDWIFAVCVKEKRQKKNYRSAPELLYSIEIFSKMYSMGCSRSQAPMRLFLCIFDKVLGRRGLLQQVTHLNNVKTETWNLHEVKPQQGFDYRCDLKEFKFGHLAFYGEDWRHNIHMLTIFLKRLGLLGMGRERIRTRWQYILRLIL